MSTKLSSLRSYLQYYIPRCPSILYLAYQVWNIVINILFWQTGINDIISNAHFFSNAVLAVKVNEHHWNKQSWNTKQCQVPAHYMKSSLSCHFLCSNLIIVAKYNHRMLTTSQVPPTILNRIFVVNIHPEVEQPLSGLLCLVACLVSFASGVLLCNILLYQVINSTSRQQLHLSSLCVYYIDP